MILRKLKENDALASDMSNFGASFKRARESKGISLDQIAAETRISTRFLLAIENEEFNLLPGGIFNRGFVRTYAEKVGLDPDQSVADYERLVQIHEPPEASSMASPRSAKGDRHLYPLAIGGLVLLVVIFYLITRETSNVQTASPAPPPSAAAVAQPTPAAPAAPLTPPTTAPEVTSAAPEPEPPIPTEALRIDLEATETTWIKVGADGTSVDPGEILEPGTTRHFTAQNSIFLAIGNAGGLVLKINDMPAKSLGKSGQVRELDITPQTINTFIR
jgi:cytoskeleton protein RodZ